MTTTRCPCQSGDVYDECCGPLHRAERPAPTAVQLMRSRYAAFVTGDTDYLRSTWHPGTRPTELALDRSVRWTGLEVLEVRAGGPFDDEGTVEFVARHRSPDGVGAQHEVSRFVRVEGHWAYLDARP